MFLLIFAPTSCALAQGSWTGKEFLDACKVLATSVDPKNDPDDPVLVGYCAGMVHTLMIPQTYSGFKICPPETATVQEGVTVLVKFSDDHPPRIKPAGGPTGPSRIPKCLALSKIRLSPRKKRTSPGTLGGPSWIPPCALRLRPTVTIFLIAEQSPLFAVD